MSDSTTNEEKPRDPEKTFREGAIAVSIWKKEAANGHLYYDFTISRSWKSPKTDEKGYTKNFYARNHVPLNIVISKACAWILEKAPESSESTIGDNNDDGDDDSTIEPVA